MSVKPKGTGAKIGFKRGGIEAEANWSLADLVALTALGLGAGGAGLLWFEPVTTVGGIVLMGGSLAYFGVKTAWSEAQDVTPEQPLLTNPKEGTIAVAAVAGLGLGWVAWRSAQRKQLARLLTEDDRAWAIVEFLGDPTELAKSTITYTNTVTALQGYEDVVARLPAQGLLDNILGDEQGSKVGDYLLEQVQGMFK